MLNPIYEKNSSVLLITVTALNVTLWKRLYLRTDILEELELPGYEALRLLKQENCSRQEKLKEVKRLVFQRVEVVCVNLAFCGFVMQ